MTILHDYEARTTVALSALALVYLFTFSAQVIVYDPGPAPSSAIR